MLASLKRNRVECNPLRCENQVMLEPQSVASEVCELFERLLKQPKLERGKEWKGKWEGWNQETWQPNCCGVYLLWYGHDDLEQNIAPVYVGEGITGTRI